MKVFRDNKNRDWSISITVGTIKRVKDLMQINLIEAVTDNLIERMKADPILLCDILYSVCKPEADAKGITDAEFGEGLAGDAIASATDALIGDLVDFFPTRQRTMLATALAKVEKAEKELTAMAMLKIETEMDAEISQRLKDFGDQFGKPPANLG